MNNNNKKIFHQYYFGMKTLKINVIFLVRIF